MGGSSNSKLTCEVQDQRTCNFHEVHDTNQIKDPERDKGLVHVSFEENPNRYREVSRDPHEVYDTNWIHSGPPNRNAQGVIDEDPHRHNDPVYSKKTSRRACTMDLKDACFDPFPSNGNKSVKQDDASPKKVQPGDQQVNLSQPGSVPQSESKEGNTWLPPPDPNDEPYSPTSFLYVPNHTETPRIKWNEAPIQSSELPHEQKNGKEEERQEKEEEKEKNGGKEETKEAWYDEYQKKLPSSNEEWQNFRKRHQQELRRNSAINVQHSASGSSTKTLDSKSIKDLRFNQCKTRCQEKMDAFKTLATQSPLKVIPADEVVKYCSTQLGGACMDALQFMDLITGLAQKKKISTQVSAQDIAGVFNVLDSDGDGILSRYHWTAAVALFFTGDSLKVAEAVFEELDEDGSGDLDLFEFAKFTTPIVHMIVPPDDAMLRQRLKEHLAKAVFKEIDTDESSLISAKEFSKWSDENSLEAVAFRELEKLLEDPDE